MQKEKTQINGALTAILHKSDGRQLIIREKNLVVDTGVDFLTAALGAPSSRPNVLSHIAIGSGGTAVANTDTALGTESAREAATYAHSAGTQSFTMTASFAPGVGTGDVVEAGVLNAASAGTLFNRVVFAAIPKEAGDTLDITFTFTFTPS